MRESLFRLKYREIRSMSKGIPSNGIDISLVSEKHLDVAYTQDEYSSLSFSVDRIARKDLVFSFRFTRVYPIVATFALV